MINPQSTIEFTRARRRAFVEEWLNFLTGRSNDLLSFDEVSEKLRLHDSAYKGLQEIELDKIVGSTGRYRDFNRTFLPKSDLTADRWRRVDAVTHEQGTPPIEVYKVGDVYFVRDGNHRVSVARMHETETIEAYVIEYKTSVPIENQDDLDDILLKMEQTEFLEETQLERIRPDHNLRFTEPGRYGLVKEHIAVHKYLKETERGSEISYEEAVASWYDNVYMPLIELIRQRDVLSYFPDRTEADLYGWLILHRSELEKQIEALGYVSNEDLVEELTRDKATSPLGWLVGLLNPKLDSQNLSLKGEQTKFLAETQLDKIRPDHRVEFTEPSFCRIAQEHIAVHKYLRETEASREISYEEAVGSWYDHVYRPVAQLLEERDVLKHFPDSTIADLYVCFVSRRAALEEEKQTLGQIPNEKIIEDFEQETLPKPIARLVNFLRQKLDLPGVLNG